MKNKMKKLGNTLATAVGIGLIGYSIISSAAFLIEDRKERLALEQRIIAAYPVAEKEVIHGDCVKDGVEYYIMGKNIYSFEDNSLNLTEFSYETRSDYLKILNNDSGIVCAEYYPPVGMFD